MNLWFMMFVGLLSLLIESYLKYCSLMGYDERREATSEQEHGFCLQKFDNQTGRRWPPIMQSIDSSMLNENGMAIVLASKQYALVDTHRNQYDSIQMSLAQSINGNNLLARNSVFMLDLNQLENLYPLPLSIVMRKDNRTLVPNDYFNFFGISIYQDRLTGHFNLLFANLVTDMARLKFTCLGQVKQKYTIEKFVYDNEKHRLIYLNSFREGLNFGQLCDLVAVNDHLFYFTKCFSNDLFNMLKFRLRMNSGEIWVYDLHRMLVYPVANRLFMPKSIEYLKSRQLILVTNLACDGLTLFKRNYDNSLSRLNDISLSKFVFNINIDIEMNVWLTVHTRLHKTFSLIDDLSHLASSRVETELIKMRLEFEEGEGGEFRPKLLDTVYSYNGTSYNALSSSALFKEHIVLFSLVNNPRVCRLTAK